MSQKVLDKVYDPKNVEHKWYSFWEEHHLFHADEKTSKETYTIMIPPPNVTGMLTMGHILNNSIQDLFIRWQKMKGIETLWMPGTDHAGIATQNKVEAAIAEEGTNRHEMGREKFLERVWDWRETYGGIIFKQLRQLGAACDWDRECFTMDDGLSQAVREVFVSLYEKDLIYRGNRLINWCPRCHTALADEEVETKDINSHFWDIAYPLKDGSGEIVVSTTRPETMLGDTAIAVHPEDERYTNLVGKTVVLPLMNREIPIVADDYADPEKGSGAVKITPAHDFNDFEVGNRHDLERINVLDHNAHINKNGGDYVGLDRFDARKKIVADLENGGVFRGKSDRVVPTPHCYRCNSVVEPYLSDQWFVKMEPLAKPALEAVRSGKIKFHPKHWEETYFHWLENIRDWCISRQIWWGHRVPVWYCENGHLTVSRTDPTECAECGSKNIRQDEDVLDTWFSSWLWPFSTLGWPEKTPDLEKFYPGNTLVTGPDIIFFWVARMIMAGLEFMGDIPFKDVYFNGMIRDLSGHKMSKSKGNSPDPLWLINGVEPKDMNGFDKKNPSYKDGISAYGADAIRFTMVYLTPLGGDIKFDHTLVDLGQRFSNKLWNAARFVLMNLDENQELLKIDDISADELALEDKWILSRLYKTNLEVEKQLKEFRCNDATQAMYSFIWTEYCDWYIELVKSRLYNEDDPRQQLVARSVATHILDNIMRLLHPLMPFITEEIWQTIPTSEAVDGVKSIMVQPYPRCDEKYFNETIESEMALVQQLIGAVRNIRGEMNVPPSKEAQLVLISTDDNKLDVLKRNELSLTKLSRLSEIDYNGERPKVSASAVVQGIEVFIPLEGLIDVDVEKARLEKEVARLEGQLVGLQKKLSNENFVSRAPKEVIEKERQKQSDWTESLEKTKANLAVLLGN